MNATTETLSLHPRDLRVGMVLVRQDGDLTIAAIKQGTTWHHGKDAWTIDCEAEGARTSTLYAGDHEDSRLTVRAEGFEF